MNTPTIRTFILPFLVGVLVSTVQPSRAAETLCGGFSEASVTNAEVIAAAQFAMKAQAAKIALVILVPAHQPAEIALAGILSAQQQVVAGVNYRLRLKVKVGGKDREAEAVVWRKLDGKQELTSWAWNQPTTVMVIGRKEYAPPNNPLSRPIEWTNACGFLIKWREKRAPEFFIYRQTPPSIHRFTTADEFFSGLGELPDGSTLDWVNTCCCPISSAMPKAVHMKLEEVAKAHRFTLLKTGEGATLVCTCESTNIVWHAETNEMTPKRVGRGE